MGRAFWWTGAKVCEAVSAIRKLWVLLMTTYELLVVKGPGKGHVYPLESDEEVIIGRDPSCQLSFDDRTLSRQHVKIVKNGDSLSIEDLDSVNGLLVNGMRVSSAELKVDDRLTLGNIELLVRPAGEKTSPLERLTPPIPHADEPTLLHQPPAERLVTSEDAKPDSIMSITQSLSSSMLMDLLGRSHQSLGAMYRVTRSSTKHSPPSGPNAGLSFSSTPIVINWKSRPPAGKTKKASTTKSVLAKTSSRTFWTRKSRCWSLTPWPMPSSASPRV
jgi:pSer/pThr/pTyr-binding forkhead associated (FHA) protein